MSRGTTGIAVAEKAEHPGLDVDTPLKIRDFRLGGMARSLTFPSRATPRGVARLAPSLPQTGRLMGCPAPAGGLVRLRLGATDATRNHALSVIVAVAAQSPASVPIWRW